MIIDTSRDYSKEQNFAEAHNNAHKCFFDAEKPGDAVEDVL